MFARAERCSERQAPRRLAAAHRPAAGSRESPVVVPAAHFDFSKIRVHAESAPAEVRADAAAAAALRGPARAPDGAPLATVPVDGGRPLADETRATLEPALGHPLAAVRIHDDDAAARFARGHAAAALTYGNHVFLGDGQREESTAGRSVVAHEVGHVIDQCAGERAAPALAAEEERAVDVVAAVEAQLAQPDPIAGIGDPSGAFAILTAVTSDEVLLQAVDALENSYLNDQLLAIEPNLPQDDVARVTAAIYTAKYARAPNGTVTKPEVEAYVALIDPMAEQRRSLFVMSIVDAHGIDEDMLTESLEGADAMRQMEDVDSAAAGPIAAAIGSVTPGKWNPPGHQPIPFYIGNEAHVAIAAHYRDYHSADDVYTNFTPVSTILTAWELLGNTASADALRDSQLDAKPDIANLTRQHLYEIKPWSSLAVAEAEALMYQKIFARAGVPMALGPVGAPGTIGAVPAPAGVYLFESLAPGAIVYQYRRAVLEPVPVKEPVTAPAKSKSRSRSRIKLPSLELPDLSLPSFHLRPLTDAERRALGIGIATAAVAATLLLLLFVFAL